MIDISNINLDELEYETKFERGVLVYYVNGLRIDKYDLIVAAAMAHNTEYAEEILEVADRLFGRYTDDINYNVLRQTVYENIIYEEIFKDELYYQSVFKSHVKEILGEEYNIVDIKSDGRNIPDAWVSNGTENIPVEMKIGTFNKKALSQLQRYLNKYKCNKGIAIGKEPSVEIPNNIQFIDISEVKKFDS